MEFKKKDLLLKEDKSEEGVIQKVLSKLRFIKDRAKSEVEETRALVRILTHAVRSYAKTREFDLNQKDREFIKGQSGDVVKNIILMVVSIIPIPIPVTPFLVIFGKKVGIDFIPKQQDIPEKGKKKENIDEAKRRKKTIIEPSDEVKRVVNVCVDLSMKDVKKFLKRDDVDIKIIGVETVKYGTSKLLNNEVVLDLVDSDGNDIKLSRSKFIDLSDIFHETLQSMGMNDLKNEYYHFFFEEQDDDTIEESHQIQFKNFLNEQKESETNFIYKLCNQAIKRKLKSSPFCNLKTYYEETPAKEKVLDAVRIIHNFFVVGTNGLNRGVFPRLVKNALQTEDAAQTLYIIAEYILDPEYSTDETKLKLQKYKGKDYVPINLDDFLTSIRSKEYTQYEDSLTKNELSQKRTFLELDYGCSDDIDMTLIKLLEVIKKSEPEQKYEKFNEIFTKVTNCLYDFMNGDSNVIKADAVYDLDEPMSYEGKPVIMPGDYIEIKKMDPEVDSYLSEFFSIFKQTKLIKTKKRDYIILYNYFVDMLFEWILKYGEVYRRKVIDGMSGIIYDNNLFVPKDQIDVYWSNKGQRGCDERRLSLRFRLRPGLDKMTGYVYEPGKGTESLVRTEVRDLPSEFKERNVCREVHFDLIGFDKEYETKKDREQVKENVKPMKLIVTNSQYKDLLNNISEQTNPCPKGVKESPLYTTKDLEKGIKLSKGYCNANSNSAIVKIQKGLQKKGLLRTTITPGYFGDETESAVKKLFGITSTGTVPIGKKTLNKIMGSEESKESFMSEFNKLTFNEKVLVITLLGEAGGEGQKGMLAVANVLKNRTKNPEFKSKGDVAKQALAPYQFSLWNPYTVEKKPFNDVAKHVLKVQKDSIPTAIKIVKNLPSVDDITNGSTHYYKDTLTFPWSKDTGLTKWKYITKIGQHIFGKYIKKKK